MKTSGSTLRTIMMIVAIAAMAITACSNTVDKPVRPELYTLHGIVLEQGSNQPVSDATVAVDNRHTTTNSSGRFEFGNMAPGTYTVHASKEGYDLYTRQFQLSADAASQQLVCTMKRSAPQFRDVTVNVSANVNSVVVPIPNARVTIADQADTTDAQGNALVTHVPYGQQLVRIEKAGYTTVEQPLEVNDATPPTIPLSVQQDGTVVITDQNYTYQSLQESWGNTRFIENPTMQKVADRAIDLGHAAGNVARILKVEDDRFNPLLMRIGGVEARASNVLNGIALVNQLHDLGFILPNEEPISAFEITRPNEEPIIWIKTNSHLLIGDNNTQVIDWSQIERNYRFDQTTTTRDDLYSRLISLYGEADQICSYYGILTTFSPEFQTAIPHIALLCAGLAGPDLIGQLLDSMDHDFGDYGRVCVFVRKTPYPGNAIDPYVCLLRIPNSNPGPPDHIELVPNPATTRVGASIQFHVFAYDAANNGTEVTDDLAWSSRGVTGTLANGLFTPWQEGSGIIHVDDTFWSLSAEAAITIGPANIEPTCEIVAIDQRDPPYEYGFTSHVNDPDDAFFSSIEIDYGDGQHDQLLNYDRNGDVLTIHRYAGPGTQTVRLVATDRYGASCQSTRQLNVQTELWQPTCSIDDPTGVPGSPRTFLITFTTNDPDHDPFTHIELIYSDGTSREFRDQDRSPLGTILTSHTFPDVGRYSIDLTATDEDGLTCTSHKDVDVEGPTDPLVITFTTCPASGRTGESVHFVVSITGGTPPYQVRWQPLGENPITNGSLEFDHTWEAPTSTAVNATAIDSRSIESESAQCALEIDSGTPTVDFTFIPSDPHTDETIAFTATVHDDDTPVADLQVRWQWETNGTWTDWSTTKTASHAYATPGTKHVTAEVKDKWNVTGSTSHDVVVASVNHAPTATITPCPLSGQANASTCAEFGYSDPDNDPMVDGELDWGDGTVEHHGAPGSFCHTYLTAGTFTVTWRVKDSHDAWSDYARCTITISNPNHAPVAIITNCPDSGQTNSQLCIEFGYYDQDGDPMADGELDWGDGTIEHHGEGSFCHTYTTAGTYTISWKVKDTHDAWSEYVYCTITIEVPPNHAPVATITNCPGSGQTNVQVCAEFNYSDQDNDTMADGELNWGDGTIDHHGAPGSYCHPYTTPGTYTISWKVKDSHDLWSTVAYCTVTISQTNHAPTASINPCPLTGQTNTATCAEFGYSDPDGDPMADGELDWGDGTVEHHGAMGSFCHTYLTAGTFTVKWRVKDSHDAWSDYVQCTATISQQNHNPVATITDCPGSGQTGSLTCAGFDYYDQDGDPMADGELNWGDGTIDHHGAPGSYCHTYQNAATYSISWRVKDSHGAWSPYVYCTVTISRTNHAPVATINDCPYQSLVNPTVCLEFDYYDQDSDAFADSRLEWGDGTNWSGYGPGSYCHTYSANGTYTVYWKVMDSRGLWSTWASCTFTIAMGGNHPPQALLDCPNEGSVLYGTCAGFDYYDQDGDPMVEGAISWGDGSDIQYIFAPGSYCHSYRTTGLYEVRYTVYNNHDGWGPSSICYIHVNY